MPILQHIAGCGLIGLAAWSALFAMKTDKARDRICTGIYLAIGLFYLTTTI